MSKPTIQWINGQVRLIDQTKLPDSLSYINCSNIQMLWQAIKRLSVRGAPALGVAGAYGIVLSLKRFKGKSSEALIKHVKKTAHFLGTSRPTAVNLFTMLDRMVKVAEDNRDKTAAKIKALLKTEADTIYEEDRSVCRQMGDAGAKLIKNGHNVLTICNTGALATVDYGTAFGVIFSAKKKQKKFHVYACETRPLLQGSRLTMWELKRSRIPATLICDSAAATLMKQGKIDAVFTGADRIAANGDTANKIGTYTLAVLVRYHKIPFYVVAPTLTLDKNTPNGKKIVIEERDADEVRGFGGKTVAPEGVKVYNPAFDVTARHLISAIITEKGIIFTPNRQKLKRFYHG